MNIKAEIINRLAKFLIGGVPYESAKRIVRDVERTDLKGTAKKEAAMTDLKELGYQLTKFGLSVAIELAWMWLETMANRALQEKA